jgi:hypothetical protein
MIDLNLVLQFDAVRVLRNSIDSGSAFVYKNVIAGCSKHPFTLSFRKMTKELATVIFPTERERYDTRLDYMLVS